CNAKRPRVVVANSASRSSRRPFSPGRRTPATTLALCTSSAPGRSTITSITHLRSIDQHGSADRQEPRSQSNLKSGLEAPTPGSGQGTHARLLTGTQAPRTSDSVRRPAPTDFHLPTGDRQVIATVGKATRAPPVQQPIPTRLDRQNGLAQAPSDPHSDRARATQTVEQPIRATTS